MNNNFFSNVLKTLTLLVVSMGLISCVGNTNNSSNSATNSALSTGTLSVTGTSNDLSLESSPDYSKDTMTNIPIGSFGLVGLQLKNIGSSTLSDIQIISPTTLPEDVTVDYTRTTCYVDVNSAANAIKSLAANESCNVILKFQPTKEETGNLILSISTKNLSQQSIMISSDTINFATRNNSPTPIVGKYAYIYSGSPSYCQVYSDGSLLNCQPLETGDMQGLSGIEVHNSHAYLISGGIDDSLKVCDVNSNGNFSNCHNNNSSSYNALNVNAVRFHNNNAYVVDSNGPYSSVNLCSIDPSTGDISSCNITAQNLLYGWDISFNNNYAYIRTNTFIYACPITDGEGNLGACTATARIQGSRYLTNLNFTQGNAYATDINLGVYQLTINPADGTLNNPESIPTISGLGNSKLAYDINIDANNAYIVQPKNGNDSVFRCQLGGDNVFSNCQKLLTGINAWGIEFN